MSSQNLMHSITVDKTPQQAFDAIRNVRGWWSRTIEGNTENLHDVFSYEVEGVHRCEMELIEFVPNKKLVWFVKDSWLSFIEDTAEWTNTNLVFDISEKDGKTEVHFTHVGLTPAGECYDVCVSAWGGYITDSLRKLIETGAGEPNQEREEELAVLRKG